MIIRFGTRNSHYIAIPMNLHRFLQRLYMRSSKHFSVSTILLCFLSLILQQMDHNSLHQLDSPKIENECDPESLYDLLDKYVGNP